MCYEDEKYIKHLENELERLASKYSQVNTNPEYPDGVPCEHPGCFSHRTHPCEKCGRISGINPRIWMMGVEGVKWERVTIDNDNWDRQWADSLDRILGGK